MKLLLIILGCLLVLWLFVWWCIFNCRIDEDMPHCFLSFRRFKRLYDVNPDRYSYQTYMCSDFCRLFLMNDYDFAEVQIQFHFISFLIFIIWDKFDDLNDSKHLKVSKKNKAYELIVNWGKKDIDALQKEAEKQVREAERLNNKVKANLENPDKTIRLVNNGEIWEVK